MYAKFVMQCCLHICSWYVNLRLRLRDTGRMDTRRCTHKRLKIYCEQLAKNCSTVYHFSRTIYSFQSGQQSNLYHLLEGLTRAFCNVCFGFPDTLFQAHKTNILEVRPRRFSNFSTARTIIQKSSCQSLGSICVVIILERQVLQIHTTFKSLQRKLELCTCYISVPV